MQSLFRVSALSKTFSFLLKETMNFFKPVKHIATKLKFSDLYKAAKNSRPDVSFSFITSQSWSHRSHSPSTVRSFNSDGA